MAYGKPHLSTKESLARGHETTDANFNNILYTGIGLLGLMVFGLVISWVTYAVFSEYTADPGKPSETFVRPYLKSTPPGPLLQSDPRKELVVLKAREDSVLSSYGRIKDDSTLVHIPIERAMQLLLQEGLSVQRRSQ